MTIMCYDAVSQFKVHFDPPECSELLVTCTQESSIYLKHQPRSYYIHIKRHRCMDPKYTTIMQYDGTFHAFHYQAVEYVLPHWDQLSWYYRALILRGSIFSRISRIWRFETPPTKRHYHASVTLISEAFSQ